MENLSTPCKVLITASFFVKPNSQTLRCFKAHVQSVVFFDWAEILLFAGENVALKLNR